MPLTLPGPSALNHADPGPEPKTTPNPDSGRLSDLEPVEYLAWPQDAYEAFLRAGCRSLNTRENQHATRKGALYNLLSSLQGAFAGSMFVFWRVGGWTLVVLARGATSAISVPCTAVVGDTGSVEERPGIDMSAFPGGSISSSRGDCLCAPSMGLYLTSRHLNSGGLFWRWFMMVL